MSRSGGSMSTTSSPEGPVPTRPRASARLCYGLHSVLETNNVWRKVAKVVESHPRAERVFISIEKSTKERGFGCRMCGQCALPTTGYACPMTCPKQLRNGPCGGVGSGGACEVYPEMQCVWVQAYERADATGHLDDLKLLQRPIDHRRFGQSSWINYWSGRDEDLAVLPVPGETRPPVQVASGTS
jgi:hypothetical protein